jgi:hypothetical protein
MPLGGKRHFASCGSLPRCYAELFLTPETESLSSEEPLALNARSVTPLRTCEPSRRTEVLANFGADLPLRELVSRL